MKKLAFAVWMIGCAPFVSIILASNDYSKLPSWAQIPLNGFDLTSIPENTDLYRLLDETSITYKKEDKWVVQRKVVQYVVTEKGAEDASYYLINGDVDTTKVKKLKGWHLNAGGNLMRLEKDNVVTLGSSSLRKINTSSTTFAHFEHVGRGSIVVFLSTEYVDTFFAFGLKESVLEEFPIAKKTLILHLDSKESQTIHPKIQTKDLEAWNLNCTQSINHIEFKDLPGYRSEWFEPDSMQGMPQIIYGFISDDIHMYDSWKEFGLWYYKAFVEASAPDAGVNLLTKASMGPLKEINTQFDEKMSYRQKYLTTSRGYIPEPGEKVDHAAYGDCKDFVSCVVYKASKSKMKAVPVLASIVDGGYPGPDSPVSSVFNHVIAAFPLAESLGLKAEIKVNDQLYLLMDPTSKYTDFGSLPAHYRDRQVLICDDSGGIWVSIPDSALEKEELDISLSGALDSSFTLKGQLSIQEKGNAAFLRDKLLTSNARDLLWHLRSMLDLPGAVELDDFQYKVSGGGLLSISAKVIWPSFFQRDLYGVRLTTCITGNLKSRLVAMNDERQRPLEWSAYPPIHWHLKLKGPMSLKAGGESCTIDHAFRHLSWKATSGKELEINLDTAAEYAFFGREDRQKGVESWSEYRKAYNSFFVNEALFRQQ